MENHGKQRLTNPYKWFVIIIGTTVSCWAMLNLRTSQIDLRFVLLVAMTVITSFETGGANSQSQHQRYGV
jgi:hypothetical protein